MANMTFKTNLLPNSDYGYSLGSIEDTSNPLRWKIHGSVNGAKIFYGTCSTAAGTTAKVVTCPEFLASDLVTGAIIFVTFTVANTGAVGSITMNVNGTGAKNIKEWRNGSVSNIPGTGYIGANQTYLFWYNGTYWCTVMDYDSNDVNRSTNTYPRLITGAVGIGRYTLFMEASDGTYQSITSTFNNTGTAHVKNTAKFKLGRVYYSNRSSDIAANDSADTANSWQDQQISLIDLRYSTNCGQTLVARKPVYLVGTVGADGYFTLADTWWTQTVPTSEDEKVYIYLGQVYNDTSPYRVAFEIENPIYWYKNGGFRLYGSGRGIANIERSGTTFTVTRDDGSTFTFDQQDNNTWRGIQDNLTSDSTTDSLSAKQGKALANGSARDSTKLPLAGGTMTGQIKTSFKSSIAMGSYQAAATTIPNIIEEVRYSSGCAGSFNLSTAYTLNNITVPTGWYNFIYIPHRSGGINGAASGDNCNYGILYLHHMSSPTQGDYRISFTNSTINMARTDAVFTANPTSDQVIITDGTTGGIKSSGYTIAASVPADAKFTDTNTWRGIQDNLTSDSATDSLSAKQGKALANGSARDSTKLPLAGGTMTGAIKRYYSAASTDPVIAVAANNQDATALWMGHGTAAGNPSGNYYKFLYKGTSSSPNNYFQLIAGVNSSSEVIAMQVNEQGNVSFTNTVAADISGNAATATAVTQKNQIDPNDYRILLSGSANDTDATEGTNKSTNLRFNPSTKVFSVGGDINATGDLTITGNTNLNSETHAESITAGSLLINGAANFVNIPTAPTPEATSNDTSIATTAFVTSAVTSLAGPMRFIGSLGTGGTATSLAAASASNKGYAYKVITAGTYQGVAAKIGDMLISNGSSWVLIPSGDEPSGTVTSITPGNGLLNGTGTTAITTSGTLNINYGTSAAKIGTASAGTATTVSRSDHVHAIDLATGDDNGQVKIAGTNVSVKGLGSNAYTSTAYLPLTGGTMTGAINLVGNQSSAWNDKGLIFTNGSRIGENGTGGLGIYAAERVYIRPSSGTSSSGDGIEISNTGVIPSNSNETLGDSSHKWSTVYATTFSGNATTATTASKLSNTSKIGDTNKPVYFTAGGVPTAISYTINKSVPSDAVFTDTHVTAVGNHYAPTADSNAALSVDASSTTAATWGSTSLVTGVNIQRDAKGHVTGVTVDSIKMPANPNADTKVNVKTRTTTAKAYIMADATAPTATAAAHEAVAETAVYMDTTAGAVAATSYKVAEKVILQYNTTTNALDFVFV